jgi:CheY-like chemotaxis protein
MLQDVQRPWGVSRSSDLSSLLIIDDDVTLLARLGAQLEEAGYEVAKSSDVSHGEQLFAELRPDLVLLEVRTSDERGWALLSRLVAEAPVVVLSGVAREEDVVRALDGGAADFIAKPYRSAELLARLRARMSVPLVGVAAPARPLPANEQAVGASVARKTDATPRRELPANDEKVFMSEAEELAMLRTASVKAAPQTIPAPDLGSKGGVGSQMRAERMRRHMTLVQVENDLKIRMSYLQAMEDEKFTLLPRGPAAPQMVKQYADHLGLDASSVLDEFKAQGYGEVVTPLPALGGSPLPRNLPRWVVLLAAVLLALAVGLGAIITFDPDFFARLPEFFMMLWAQLQGLLTADG